MSELDRLIANYCQTGVQFISIGELVRYEQPGKYIVNSTEYDDSYDVPVLTPGQSFILGYTCEKEGIYYASKNKPVILFDDFTGAFKWVDFSFKVKSSAVKMLKANEEMASLRYIYHVMGWLNYSSTEHKRLWISRYSKIEIPLPPDPVQKEIVRILDAITDLSKELTVELAARKKQYRYYLNRLFENQKDCLIPLSEVGELTRGKRFVHDDAVDNGVPCIHYGELYTYYGVYSSHVKSHIREELREKMRYANKGDVIIVAAGENNIDIGIGVAWEGEEAVAVHDACYVLNHPYNPRYISYFLRSDMYHNQIKKYVSSAKICSISAKGIGKAMIPIPSMKKQNEIVLCLDHFEELCNSGNNGIQAEIKYRQKQYGYYRDQVFNRFKKGEIV